MFFWMALCVVLLVAVTACASDAGPLRVHPQNPRYFTDKTGKAILLTGSHTWNNLVDMGTADPPQEFDYAGFLDFLRRYGHNFFRLWTWELTNSTWNDKHYAWPQPWKRTGPGNALDGKPKFDLTRYEKAYFERLSERVKTAGEQGFYVSVMLFEGWELQVAPKPWEGHPFNVQNNVNGVNGDPNGDGKGIETRTLSEIPPAVLKLQEAYVRKVIDTVNAFDNVLYEISNEAGATSAEWQYHMIRYVKSYEARKPKQHPVGMTFAWQGGRNADLFASPADWISPNPEGGYDTRMTLPLPTAAR